MLQIDIARKNIRGELKWYFNMYSAWDYYKEIQKYHSGVH
jgi:hypothetical protein